jgi:hypothetical protein
VKGSVLGNKWFDGCERVSEIRKRVGSSQSYPQL